MTATSPPEPFEESTKGAWANGVALFAGVVLATVGVFQFLVGLSALFNDKIYVTTRNYAYQFDLTAWGWIHLILGLLAVAVGLAIIWGQTWARIVGIILAVLSAMSSFMFIPYQPVWSIVVIAFDVAVIWALAVQMENAAA